MYACVWVCGQGRKVLLKLPFSYDNNEKDRKLCCCRLWMLYLKWNTTWTMLSHGRQTIVWNEEGIKDNAKKICIYTIKYTHKTTTHGRVLHLSFRQCLKYFCSMCILYLVLFFWPVCKKTSGINVTTRWSFSRFCSFVVHIFSWKIHAIISYSIVKR